MSALLIAGVSLACLGLCLAIYGCNLLSRPGSWLRSEMLAMILLSLLVGLYPIAAAGSLFVLLGVGAGPIEPATPAGPALGLLAAAAAVATAEVFRRLVSAGFRPPRRGA